MPSPTLLVTADRVIADPERPPLDRAAVLVRGDLIEAVGPAERLVEAAPDAERLDFPGATVVPGLVNAHVHLAFDVTDDPRTALEAGDLDATRRTVATNARSVLDGGVTTVRDLGDPGGVVAAFRDAVAAGDALGPRVLTAFSPLTPPRGHCWFLGGELDTSPTGTRESERVIRAAVEERAAAGADVIKVMASGGNLTPSGAPMWKSQFSAHDIAVIVDAAHGHGLPVAGHAHGTDAMELCARAGVDTIEHGSWRAPPDRDGEVAYDLSERVAGLVAASGAVVVPTRSRGWSTWPPQARLDQQLERLRFSDAHGIPIIAGNDAGVGRGWFDDLVDAVTLLAQIGWSAPRALAAATTRAAQALGLGDRVGRIEPGWAADLLVLDADPLRDLRALGRVRRVVHAGRVHDPHSDRHRASQTKSHVRCC